MIEDIVLYDGQVRLKFNHKSHRYQVDGRAVPSVTTILDVIGKPFLISWAVNEMARYILEQWTPFTSYDPVEISNIVEKGKNARLSKSKDATEVGRDAHEWIETYIQNKIRGTDSYQPLPSNPSTRFSVEAFLQWERNHSIRYIHSERRVYSRKYNFSGTVDLLAVVDGVTSVIDFKTSKAIYPDYFLQGGAYAQALLEEGIIKSLDDVQVIIVRIPKDGGDVEVAYHKDVPYLIEVFGHALALYEYKEGEKKNE